MRARVSNRATPSVPELAAGVFFGPGSLSDLEGRSDPAGSGPAELTPTAGPESDRWRAHLLARVTRFALGEDSTLSRMGREGRLTLTRQTALEASALYCRDFDRDWFDGGVSWNLFF